MASFQDEKLLVKFLNFTYENEYILEGRTIKLEERIKWGEEFLIYLSTKGQNIAEVEFDFIFDKWCFEWTFLCAHKLLPFKIIQEFNLPHHPTIDSPEAMYRVKDNKYIKMR